MAGVITERQRQRIFQLKTAGLSIRQIAKTVRVSPDTVSRLVGRSPLAVLRLPTPTRARYGDNRDFVEDRELRDARARLERRKIDLEQLELDARYDAYYQQLANQRAQQQRALIEAYLRRRDDWEAREQGSD